MATCDTPNSLTQTNSEDPIVLVLHGPEVALLHHTVPVHKELLEKERCQLVIHLVLDVDTLLTQL